MTHWKIVEGTPLSTYVIFTETSIWFTQQANDADMESLIANKALGTVKSFRYEDLKELIFIDTDLTMELVFKDDKTPEEIHKIAPEMYNKLKTYLKQNLKGIEIKDYTLFKQLIPQLSALGISVIAILLIFSAAQDLENGVSVSTSGRRAWIKKLAVALADILGTTGTIIAGGLIVLALTYALVKKAKNPKKGDILKMNKAARLAIS